MLNHLFIVRETTSDSPCTEICGVYSSYDKALDRIKDIISQVMLCYEYSRFVIEEWEQDGEYVKGHYFTKEDQERLAVEVGAYVRK